MQTPAHILIVDDDLETRKLPGRYLTDEGYRVSLASDQRTTKKALLVGEVSLIVLDVLLPDGSGLDVCRDLRREGSDISGIILMALKEDVDRIICLEIGADEYLGKPFNRPELLARIRAVLRRSPNGFRASRARLAQLAGSQPHWPPRVWFGIAGWMGLISIGVIGVALIVAHQATKQLKFLGTMAKAVGNDGILPRVPEEGSAEIRATARALNMMGEGLRNAVESRMRLVAAAGHDLRTPMTRMRLRAEFLDDEERSQWLHDLDELDRIADRAVQLVREESAGKGTEPVRLDTLIRQTCRELSIMKRRLKCAVLTRSKFPRWHSPER